MPQESQPAPLHQRLLNRVLAPAPWQWLFLLLLCVISFLALAPVPPKDVDTGWDKANHALAFAVLAFVGVWAFASRPHQWLWLVLALLAYGGGIEVAQSYLPPREADLADLLADAVGIALGLLVAWPLAALVAPRR